MEQGQRAIPLGDFAALGAVGEGTFRERVEEWLDVIRPVRWLGKSEHRKLEHIAAYRQWESGKQSSRTYLEKRYRQIVLSLLSSHVQSTHSGFGARGTKPMKAESIWRKPAAGAGLGGSISPTGSSDAVESSASGSVVG